MRVSAAIYNILSNSATVAQQLGTGDRIFPLVAKATQSLPFIIYEITQDDPVQTKDGQDSSYIRVFRLEILCYAETYNSVTNIASAARRTLNRAPNYPSTSYGAIKLQSINYINSTEEFEAGSGKNGIYRTRLVFEVRQNTIS
tara:strand:- start:9574 stop:10002 length:429 start_codon:yes stop_codon:yes gene_type:complete